MIKQINKIPKGKMCDRCKHDRYRHKYKNTKSIYHLRLLAIFEQWRNGNSTKNKKKDD